MNSLDYYAIHTLGCPSSTLMQKAAASMWGRFLNWAEENRLELKEAKLLFCCGNGNNGGDAFLMAKLALEMGFCASLLLQKRDLYEPLSVPCFFVDDFDDDSLKLTHFLNEYDYLFDGFLGTGVNRPVKGTLEKVMECWNSLAEKTKVAIDIPSGCGYLGNPFFHANLTLTVEFYKELFYTRANRAGCGEILLCSNIFPKEAIAWHLAKPSSTYQWHLTNDLSTSNFKSPDPVTSYKGNRGRVTAVVGSTDYSGVAFLVAKQISHLVGFARMVVPKQIKFLTSSLAPSVVVHAYKSNLNKIAQQSDFLLLGSGWKGGLTESSLLKRFLRFQKPTLLDGGALQILSKHPRWIKYSNGNWILTPHIGEFRKLCDGLLPEIKERCKERSEVELLAPLSRKLNAVVVLKGSISKIAIPQKEGVHILYFDSSRAHLGVAGSGDLLAAIIASLYPYCTHESRLSHEWVADALSLHATAADLAYKEKGWISATDMIAYVASEFAKEVPSLKINGKEF